MESNKITVVLEDDTYNNNISANEEESASKQSSTPQNFSSKKSKTKAQNQKQKKQKRRSRLIMSEESDSVPEHRKEIYEGETKILKSIESASLFNSTVNLKRNVLAKHFLKRKIKYTLEREDKFPMFFGIRFLPTQDKFSQNQLQRIPQPQNFSQRPGYAQGVGQQGNQISNNTNLQTGMNQNYSQVPRPQQSQIQNNLTLQQQQQQQQRGGMQQNNGRLFQVNNGIGSINNVGAPIQSNPHSNPPTQSTSSSSSQRNSELTPEEQLRKKQQVIQRVTEKYLANPQQLKNELGESEFLKVERYLRKKGIISCPGGNPTQAGPRPHNS